MPTVWNSFRHIGGRHDNDWDVGAQRWEITAPRHKKGMCFYIAQYLLQYGGCRGIERCEISHNWKELDRDHITRSWGSSIYTRCAQPLLSVSNTRSSLYNDFCYIDLYIRSHTRSPW